MLIILCKLTNSDVVYDIDSYDESYQRARILSAKKNRRKLVKDMRDYCNLNSSSDEDDQRLFQAASTADDPSHATTHVARDRRHLAFDVRELGDQQVRVGRKHRNNNDGRMVHLKGDSDRRRRIKYNDETPGYCESADSLSDSGCVSDPDVWQTYLKQAVDDEAGIFSFLPPEILREGNSQFTKVKSKKKKSHKMRINEDSKDLDRPADGIVDVVHVDRSKKRHQTKVRNVKQDRGGVGGLEDGFDEDWYGDTFFKKHHSKKNASRTAEEGLKSKMKMKITASVDQLTKMSRKKERSEEKGVRSQIFSKKDAAKRQQTTVDERLRGKQTQRHTQLSRDKAWLGFVGVEDPGTFKTLKSSTLLKSNPKLVKVKVYCLFAVKLVDCRST